jgi:hypothetical protein
VILEVVVVGIVWLIARINPHLIHFGEDFNLPRLDSID